MKKLYCLHTFYNEAILFCFCFAFCLNPSAKAQTPITLIAYSNSSLPTATETNIKGAGYSFSQWTTAANFTINYASTASNDILSITSFNVGAVNNFIPITYPSAITKVQRVGNAVINDNRNFITYWNRISSSPAAGAISGTFNCDAPKVTSMEAALSSNNINSGYDNIFNNTIASPHYGNIERVDFIVPGGFYAIATPNKAGFAVFDRGVGDDFKIAAITSVDASNNPTGYKTLVTVLTSKFSAAGLLLSGFDYTIFVSDPNVASGESRPSTKTNQNIRGVYISLQDLGIAVNEKIYGYSLFGQDVDPALGHVLTNPSTFPLNTSFANSLDPLNVLTLFQSGLNVLPVRLNTFNGLYNKRNNSVDLKWNTSFEQGLNYFNIEKSNNSTDWNSISTMNALGNINGSDYFFTDKSLGSAAKLYYRLKLVNDDGTFQYSNIALFQQALPTEINLMISETNLVVKTVINIKEAHIFDMSGKEVQPQKDKIAGVDIEFSLNSLPTGMYVIVLFDQNNSPFSKKFMKL